MAKRRKENPEFRFKIEAYSPQTMPLARLAEYLTELAAVLGESGAVHLVRLEPGSTSLVHEIEPEAIPKIIDRTEAVKAGNAPRDAQVAYRRINRYLRSDNARAVFRRGSIRGRKILIFPGIDEAEEPYRVVKQFGSISGAVVRIGGVGDPVPVLLESEGEQISGCYADRHVAKNLARYLFEPVRLSGEGQWERDNQGVWGLKHFTIEHFGTLEDKPLSGALTDLRKIVGNDLDEAWDDLAALRHGRRDNGSN